MGDIDPQVEPLGTPPTDVPDAIKMETRISETLDALLASYDELDARVAGMERMQRRQQLEALALGALFTIGVYLVRREVSRVAALA